MNITSEELASSVKILMKLALTEGIMNSIVAEILTHNPSKEEILDAIPIEALENLHRAQKDADELLCSAVGSVIQQIPLALLVTYNSCHTDFDLIYKNSPSEADFLQNLPIEILEEMSNVQTSLQKYGVIF